MSQTQNLSTRNALTRLSLGLSMLAYGTAKLARNPKCNKGRMMVAFGAMKAAEGTVKFCPMKAMIQNQSMVGQTSNTPEIGKLMKDFASQGMSGQSGSGSNSGSGSATGSGTGATTGAAVGNMVKDLASQAMSGQTTSGAGAKAGSGAGAAVGNMVKDLASQAVSGQTTSGAGAKAGSGSSKNK
ncbi:hypothetical protein HMPREF1210_02933 [Paenisporosarcina sp. HGH0030]|uniref:YgaP-like transmembrane domain n=1 Tax=Paenisporosarcina sp. HGH0030 TaxID=1078085 RepID=UPI00034E9591|nr:YgaP-like transmembrane domain [Paenisporosarcina sp. HGH0030]EPD50362.1 hypothetical protein HMPREF1210_02933 [Paenisporosarcina sp. HGH0030]